MGKVSRTQVVKFIRKGDTGDKGERGPALRGPQAWSDCATGYAFQAGNTGEEWKDVVLYNGNYYSCKKSHTKTASNYPGSTTAVSNGYWQLGDKIELVATKILLATYALVENLGVTAIDMKDKNGDILFQAKNGNVTCKTGTFENVNISGKLKGSVRNPFVSAGDSFDTDYSDNVVMLSNDSGGWVYTYSLPWDATQSGRRITIVNYRWGSLVSTGQAGISAPSGKYFYINGIAKDELIMSREVIELLGYGTSSQFYGWIVLRRTDIMTNNKYGRELKVLAFGSVFSSGSISYKTFDGSKLTCSRQSSEGRYLINMPIGWFGDASHCSILLTGVGFSEGSNSAPIKATLLSKSLTWFTVNTSDDASSNWGAFDFVIFNNNDWL